MNTVIPDISYIQEYKLLLMAKERQNLSKDLYNYLLERQWIESNKLTPLGLQMLQVHKHKLQVQLYFILDEIDYPEFIDVKLQLGIEESDYDTLPQLQEIAVSENLLIMGSEGLEVVSNNFKNGALLAWRNKLEKDFRLSYNPSL